MSYLGFGTAVVTGASSGIGEEFAKQIASHGTKVILVARRLERLEKIAAEIIAKGGQAKAFACDLENPADRLRLVQLIEKGEVDLLINNAGFGKFGKVTSIPVSEQVSQVQLNILALTELSCVAARAFEKKGKGGILNVASAAAFQPVPLMSVYAASKSYVKSFSEGLRAELEGSGVKVGVLCPGATVSEFFDRASTSITLRQKPMSAKKCVEIALEEFAKNKCVIVPGSMNGLNATVSSMLPAGIVRMFTSQIYKNK
jgi:short-subunit dehydrogenase